MTGPIQPAPPDPGGAPAPGSEPPATPRSRGRWRVPVGAAAAAALVAGGIGAVYLTRDAGPATAPGTPPAATATIVRTDLVETVTIDGELGYGTAAPLFNRLAGTVTSVPAEGATIRRGGTLYALDARPVLLMLGSLPAYRTLEAGTRGSDVEQFERNLRELGYTGFTVDRSYTSATERAVQRWQRARGLDDTGEVELGRVVFLPRAVRVAQVTVRPGRPVTPDASVLSYTGTSRVVTADLEVAERSLVKGGEQVSITLPGSKTVSGTVSRVGTVATAEQAEEGSGPAGEEGSGSADPTVSITCSVSDQRALGDLDGTPVRIALPRERRDDVLAAPVASLLALREGGYGVRLVEGDANRIVPVRTGLFAGGLVEVSGPGLTEGVTVEAAPS
ncbi:peptidoglycan-binding protein [Plantactinospora sp. CA-290183]|uniref:peptidoglycan-binding protein n=1 Tax=Plantactinospora sp. CA-290183 TaxID=3240006 RepID=UPI003D8AF1D6